MDDFDFVSQITERLGIRAQANGLESLSEHEQRVFLVWWASGIIGNGGFRFFYEGATNIKQVADAYEALGFVYAAQACRATIALFPADVLANGSEACQQWLDGHYTDEELSRLFRNQDAVLWEINDDLPAALAEHIRAHPSEFQALESKTK